MIQWRQYRASLWDEKCIFIVLSSGAKLDLTPNLRAHVSRLMEQYKALIEKANSGSQQDLPSLYQSLSKLEPVAKLVQKFEDKTEVNSWLILA